MKGRRRRTTTMGAALVRCPECGAHVVQAGGCCFCPECGWAACG
ncbi:MAG TPA: hypothetical protein VGQ83_01585 [Polyangia bacterium]